MLLQSRTQSRSPSRSHSPDHSPKPPPRRSLVADLELGRLGEGPAPLVRHVVDDEDAARVGHLAVVAVVRLGDNKEWRGVGWKGGRVWVVVVVCVCVLFSWVCVGVCA